MFRLLILTFILIVKVESQQSVVVTTQSGPIRGYVADPTLTPIHFLGIPYAKAPIGELRWQKTQPVVPWTEVFDAETDTKLGVACVQNRAGSRTNLSMSEDCLTLNIYTTDLSGKKAVMFDIHGGAYRQGTAREHEGKYLAAREDVVVVTINYRLSIFGFFDSDGDGVWENYGFWDMRMALQWVQDNIEAFGGDKDRVTIMGSSSGGMTVTQLAASPVFEGLFHRIISQSGTMLCPRLLSKNSADIHARVLEGFNCNTTDCLKQVDAERLQMVAGEMEQGDKNFEYMYTFGAYNDDTILPANPLEVWRLYRDGSQVSDSLRNEMVTRFQSYDYMGGFNTQEGSKLIRVMEMLARQRGFSLEDGANDEVLEIFLKEYLEAYFPKTYNDKAAYFRQLFLEGVEVSKEPSPELAQIIMNMYTALVFATPTLHLLDSHSKQTKTSTYLYTFTHETQDAQAVSPSWFRGSRHTDERTFVFGKHPAFYQIENYNYTTEEQRIMDQMMATWANFAKTGNPNGLNLDRTIRQYSVSHQYFTQFGADQVDVSSRFYNMRKIQAIRSGELISNGEDSNPSTNKYDVYNTFLPIIVLCTLSHKIIQYIWESR